MYYTSINHFLAVHEADLVDIMVRVQERVGGHYAQMMAEERRAGAAGDMQFAISVWRTPQIVRDEARTIAEQTVAAGVDLTDLTRLVDMLQAELQAFITERLMEQPDLAAEILRLMRYSSNNYRSGVTEVKIDTAIRRISPP